MLNNNVLWFKDQTVVNLLAVEKPNKHLKSLVLKAKILIVEDQFIEAKSLNVILLNGCDS